MAVPGQREQGDGQVGQRQDQEASQRESKGHGSILGGGRTILDAGFNPDDHEYMLDWRKCEAEERVPGKVSGAWLFKDTRVPVTALFENLEAGATVVVFLEWFPGVTGEQVGAVLAHAE